LTADHLKIQTSNLNSYRMLIHYLRKEDGGRNGQADYSVGSNTYNSWINNDPVTYSKNLQFHLNLLSAWQKIGEIK